MYDKLYKCPPESYLLTSSLFVLNSHILSEYIPLFLKVKMGFSVLIGAVRRIFTLL